MAKKDGDGSYEKLFANVYGMNKTNITITRNYKENNIEILFNEIIMLLPLSYKRYNYYGNFSHNGKFINFWENNSVASNTVEILYSFSEALYSQAGTMKGQGNSLRCVARISLILIKL